MSIAFALWQLGIDWLDVFAMHREFMAAIDRSNAELLSSFRGRR